MITDTREIAKRLRIEAGYWGDYNKDETVFDMSDNHFTESMLTAFGFGDMEMHAYKLFGKMADLFDRPTTTRHGRFMFGYLGREMPCCEVCGNPIRDMDWHYCPKCGAAITDD